MMVSRFEPARSSQHQQQRTHLNRDDLVVVLFNIRRFHSGAGSLVRSFVGSLLGSLARSLVARRSFARLGSSPLLFGRGTRVESLELRSRGPGRFVLDGGALGKVVEKELGKGSSEQLGAAHEFGAQVKVDGADKDARLVSSFKMAPVRWLARSPPFSP